MLKPDQWVPLAEVARPHGVKGELRLKVFNSDSNILLGLDEVLVRLKDGEEHEVSVDRATGQVRVRRIVQSFECGAIINPDHLKNQIEGAIVQGLGGALFECLRFENGRILNPRFSQYRVPRFSDMPAIEVVLVDRKDLKSEGAGEAPIVGIAPAIGNAIFDAVGVRLRSLPMVPNGLKV